jgi:hypothetical protein
MAAMGMVARTDELTIAQQGAIEALRNGCSFVRAAEAAGVSRVTLYRWVRADAAFRAAYNAWQAEMADSARARLLKLTDQAVDVVEAALRRNDEKTAVQMLKDLGVLRPRRRGSTDAEVVGLQIDLQQKREYRKASTAMMRHLLGKAGKSRKQQRQIINNPEDPFVAELERLVRMKNEAGPAENVTLSAGEGETLAGKAEAAGMANESIADNPFPAQEIGAQSAGPDGGSADVTLTGSPGGVLHDSEERAIA